MHIWLRSVHRNERVNLVYDECECDAFAGTTHHDTEYSLFTNANYS